MGIKFLAKENRFDGNYIDTFLELDQVATHNTVEQIQLFVERNYRDITASQLRNIYSRLKTTSPQSIPIMRTKLAYVQGRTEKKQRGMHTLLEILDQLMKGIGPDDHKSYKGLLAFMESVLAYHKYFEKVKKH